MNFYNHFRETWAARFPQEGVPELDCLKADQYSTVLDQKSALERTEHEVDDQIEEIKCRYLRKLFLHDYIRKCISKLSAISRVVDEFDGSLMPATSTPTPTMPTVVCSPIGVSTHSICPPILSMTSGMQSNLGLGSRGVSQHHTGGYMTTGGTLMGQAGTHETGVVLSHGIMTTDHGNNSTIAPDAIKLESEMDFSHMIPMDHHQHQVGSGIYHPHHRSVSSHQHSPVVGGAPPLSSANFYTPEVASALHTHLSALPPIIGLSSAPLPTHSLPPTSSNAPASGPSSGDPSGQASPDDASRPYRCPVCGRGFAVKAGVMQHMRTHTGERPYPCGVCGRAFKQKIQLTTHMRVHSGERPYGCKLCGKLFRQQSHVVQHLRTHTGEKPHKCFRCGKAFRQKYSLIAHHRRKCRNRASHSPIAAGMTMWIGPSSVPGGATVKSLAPTGLVPCHLIDNGDGVNGADPVNRTLPSMHASHHHGNTANEHIVVTTSTGNNNNIHNGDQDQKGGMSEEYIVVATMNLKEDHLQAQQGNGLHNSVDHHSNASPGSSGALHNQVIQQQSILSHHQGNNDNNVSMVQ